MGLNKHLYLLNKSYQTGTKCPLGKEQKQALPSTHKQDLCSTH